MCLCVSVCKELHPNLLPGDGELQGFKPSKEENGPKARGNFTFHSS